MLTGEVFAQKAIVDSLETELRKAATDSAKILYSVELAMKIGNVRPDSAHLLCQQAGAIVHRLENPELRTKALRLIGKSYQIIRQLDTALIFYERAKQLAIEIGNRKLLADVLNNFGSAYRDTNDTEKSLDHFFQSLEVYKEVGDKPGQIAALNNIGIIHMENGELSQALSDYEQALILLQETGNKSNQAALLQNMGLIYNRQNKLKECISQYEKALQIRLELGQMGSASTVLSLLGSTLSRHGNFIRAQECYQRSLKIAEELGDMELKSRTLKSLGVLHNSLKEYDKALAYLRECLQLRKETKDRRGQASVLNSIGRNLMFQGAYEQALHNLHASLSLRRKVGPEQSEPYPLYNIGSTFEKLGHLDSAYFYLQEAMRLSTKHKSKYLQTLCLTDLGRVYWRRGQTQKAVNSLESAYSLTSANVLHVEKADITSLLYKINKEEGNYKKALQYLEKHDALQDSLFNVENTRELTRQEAAYEFEKEKQQLAYEKEKELLVVDSELRRQRSLQIATVMALVIALVFILVIMRYSRLKQRSNAELQRLNSEILQQKERLEELDKVKSRFFTNISHEFRTPLTVIGGMVDQIGKSPQKWLERGLKMIKHNNANLLNLVNQILDLRKLETGGLQLNMIQGNIVFYLQYITDSFHSLAENKNIKIHFSECDQEIMMDYDKEKILRVVSNLLSNAIKFTPEGGDIYFSIGRQVKDNTPMLHLQIRDTGIGIAREKLPYIFDRFYQIDSSDTRKGEGTGIGLALVNELVKLMEGECQVESEVDKGATFTILLPIRQNASPSAEPNGAAMEDMIFAISEHEVISEALASTNSEVTDRAKLLVIEDNLNVIQYIESILENDYELLVATDGQEGINMAIEQIPHLIISDVMMPLKDGFEVCETLKKDVRTSHIPIVMLTARADDDSRIAGLERGADAYLAKPFNQKELLVRLEKLLEIRRMLQQRYQTLGPMARSDDKIVQQEDSFISRVKKITETHLNDSNFGIPELCQEIGMSRSQLHLKIKALTNRSTTHFIRLIRLHRAKELLQTSGLNITQVAYEVGFNDPSYFSRTFTEEFNLSPRKFVKS